jgi:hypothetical protein
MVSKRSLAIVNDQIAFMRPFSKSMVSMLRTEDLKRFTKSNSRYYDTRYDLAFNEGYRTLIRIIAPTPKFFQHVSKLKSEFGKPILVELCSDMVMPD